MAAEPKKLIRPKQWTDEVEEAYRFQTAGYRDEAEYNSKKPVGPQADVHRWPHNNYVKRIQRKDGCYYYFNKERECLDKDVHKTKLYVY